MERTPETCQEYKITVTQQLAQAQFQEAIFMGNTQYTNSYRYIF